MRQMKKSQQITAIMAGAETVEGRKEALEKLQAGFGKGDAQALLARANLEMQDDPRKALATLESIDLSKQDGGRREPGAGHARADSPHARGRGGSAQARRRARPRQAGRREASGDVRDGCGGSVGALGERDQGGSRTLELFNPEDPEFSELRAQMWRARAFAYAANQDTKGVTRALKKLADMNPHLLGMFVGQKRIHPLLEREARQVVMRLGVVPRKVVRQRM